MAQMTIEHALQQAVAHHQAGRLQQAEALYRQVLNHQPNQPDALMLLGVIARQVGQPQAAIELIHQAIAQRPQWAEALNNLGNALKDAGKLDDAVTAYQQAIEIKGDFADAYNNLGNVLFAREQFLEAVDVYQKAVSLKPTIAQAISNLAHALEKVGRRNDAIIMHRRSVAIQPGFADAHCNLANALLANGQLDEAIAVYRRAVVLNPNSAELHSNFGCALKDRGISDEAVSVSLKAVALKPELAEAHSNLSNAFRANGQIDEAIASAQRAIILKAKYAEAYGNLGFAYTLNGQIDEALAAYRQAIALSPNNQTVQSNYLITLYYQPGLDAVAIANEHARWAQKIEGLIPSRSLWYIQEPDQTAHDPALRRTSETGLVRLKIGYVSPDFLDHPVGRFLEPLLANHDREKFEIIAYAQVSAPDAMTARLRSHTDIWRDISGISDAQLGEMIRKDQVHILVDLTLHAAHNRLTVFARKPAPVQVSWLAYPGSTGLKTIDYRLSDPYLDPVGMDESIYSEKTVRLPDSYWCYQPHTTAPPVNPLPAIHNGHITFGCLNNFFKVNENVLHAWGQILQAIPNSRLLLHAFDGSSRRKVTDFLHTHGISNDRVEFVERVPLPDYFRLYGRIDIALDTFPFAGGTTTCDALWMGVPVLSLIGQTSVGRGGLSVLTNVGHPELCADSVDRYVQIAIDLASDVPRLTQLRETLREQMQRSPLMDAPRFARNIEAAYGQMCERSRQDAGL